MVDPPAGYPVPELPEMPNEHSPGLNDLNALIDFNYNNILKVDITFISNVLISIVSD